VPPIEEARRAAGRHDPSAAAPRGAVEPGVTDVVVAVLLSTERLRTCSGIAKGLAAACFLFAAIVVEKRSLTKTEADSGSPS
jgi:hypothetical protein